MNRVKRAFATVGLSVGILVGAVVAAPVATAAPAHAFTATQCHTEWYKGWQAYTVCYYDYNWFEESWMGGSHRDGWYQTGISRA